MPPSTTLHIPARSVPRPGGTRLAFASSPEAGRPSFTERAEPTDEVGIPIGDASSAVVLRLLGERYGFSPELEEREREEEGNGPFVGVIAAVVFVMALAAISAGAFLGFLVDTSVSRVL